MAIEFVGASTDARAGGGWPAVARPSGVTDGDVLLACVAGGQGGGSIIVPTGWSVRHSGIWRDGTRPYVIAYKVIDSIEAEPSSYTFSATWTTTFGTSADVLAFRGVDTSEIFATLEDAPGPTSNSSPITIITLPEITTLVSNSLAVTLAFRASAGSAPTFSRGVTVFSSGTTHMRAAAVEAFSVAGDIGSISVTSSSTSAGFGGYRTALRPAAGPPPVTARPWWDVQVVE